MVASTLNWPGSNLHTVWRRGSAVHFSRAGAGNPLVLLPGLCGGVGLLEPLITLLSARFEVFALQFGGEQGFVGGQSQQMSDYVESVDHLVSELGLERPALAGVSFGGAVALEYAARGRPIASLTVQGVGPRFSSGLAGNVARTVLGRFPIAGDNPLLGYLFRKLAGNRRPSRSAMRFIIEQCWTTDQLAIASRLSALAGFDLTGRLTQFDFPFTVVVGDDDVIVAGPEAKRLADEAPDGRLQTLPGAGHFAFVTHPHAVARVFTEQLAASVH